MRTLTALGWKWNEKFIVPIPMVHRDIHFGRIYVFQCVYIHNQNAAHGRIGGYFLFTSIAWTSVDFIHLYGFCVNACSDAVASAAALELFNTYTGKCILPLSGRRKSLLVGCNRRWADKCGKKAITNRNTSKMRYVCRLARWCVRH